MTDKTVSDERMERSVMIDTIAERLFEQIIEHTVAIGSENVNERSNVIGDKMADAMYEIEPTGRIIWYYAISKVMVMLARVAQAEAGVPPMATLCTLVKVCGHLMTAQDAGAMQEAEGATKQ
jgi:hypothetical protein